MLCIIAGSFFIAASMYGMWLAAVRKLEFNEQNSCFYQEDADEQEKNIGSEVSYEESVEGGETAS